MSTNLPRRSNFNSRSHSISSTQAFDEFTIENYKRKNKELESEISDLQKELHNYRMKEGDSIFTSTLMKFSAEKKRKRDEYDESSCNDTSQSVVKAEQQNSDSSHLTNGKPQITLEEHEKKIAEYCAKVENLEKENSDFKNQSISLKELYAKLEQECKQVKDESDNLLSENKRITEVSAQNEQAAKKIENEIELLRNELKQKENILNQANQEVEAKKNELETVKSELEIQIKHLTTQLEQNQQPVTQIINNDEKEKELTQQIKNLEEVNSKLQQDIDSLNKEKSSLEQLNISLNSDLINSQEQEKERVKKINELESTLSQLDDDKKRLELVVKENETLANERVLTALSESESKDVRITVLEKENQNLSVCVAELNSQIDSLTHNQSHHDHQLVEEIENQKQLVTQKSKELEEKTAKVVELDSLVQKLQQDLSNEKVSNNELASQIQALSSEISTISESHTIALNDKTTLQNSIQTLETDKNQLISQIKELQNQIEILQASISKNENEKQSLQSSLSEYDTQLGQSSEQINLLKKQIESLKQVERQVESLNSENSQLKQQSSSYTELLKKREGELSDLKEKEHKLVQQNNEEVKSIHSNYQETIQKRDAKLSNLENEIQELKKALESIKSEKSQLDAQKKTLEEKITETNTLLEQEKMNQEKLSASLNEKNTMYTQLKSEKSGLVEEISKMKAKEELLQATIERYRAEEEEAKNRKEKKGVKRDIQEDTSAPISTMDPPKKKVKNDTKKEFKVIFSGFNDKIAKYTNAYKKTLEDNVKELGGVLVDEVDAGATHVIAPPGVRTIKVLQAAVAHIWIMSPEWLDECKKQSKLVDESSFGKMREEELFKGKNVSFTDAFKKECENSKYKAQKRMSNAKTLVEGGSGAVTEMDEAELILVAAEESLSSNGRTKRVFTWEGFLDYIFPKH